MFMSAPSEMCSLRNVKLLNEVFAFPTQRQEMLNTASFCEESTGLPESTASLRWKACLLLLEEVTPYLIETL